MEILYIVLSSSLAVVVVETIKELILWRLNRKATVDDREDSISKRISGLEERAKKNAASLERLTELLEKWEKDAEIQHRILKKSCKSLLSDRIRHITMEKLQQNEITFSERKELIEMWEIYHYDLDGNGTFDAVMEQIHRMPTIPD
jgi:aminoglycoside phosphotransferase family enzyme